MKIKKTSSEPDGTPTSPPTESQSLVIASRDPNIPLQVSQEWRLPLMDEDEENRRWEELDRKIARCGAALSKRLTKDYFRAKEEFGRLMAFKLTPEVIGVNLVESSEILQDSIREASRAMEETNNPKDKIDALMAITVATRAQGDITLKMSRLYRAGQQVRESTRPRINTSRAPSADVPFIVAQNVEIRAADPARNDTGNQVKED